jgi:hypothetical protein
MDDDEVKLLTATRPPTLVMEKSEPPTIGIKPAPDGSWGFPGMSQKELSLARAAHAMNMRASGFTYDEIAEAIQTSEERARDIVRDSMRRAIAEPADEIRHQEHFRLEKLMAVVWPRAMRGDGFAVDRALRIMERKAKLLGLDAPAELDIRQIRVELFTVLRDSLDSETYARVLEAVAD